MLSLVFTSLGIISITISSSSCVLCMSCALLSALTLFFPCGDDTPPSSTTNCFVSCSGSISRPYYVEPMASSTCCGPCPLDASDFICSVSYSSCSGSCVGSWSSSTRNVVFFHSSVCISSISTTVVISLVLV